MAKLFGIFGKNEKDPKEADSANKEKTDKKKDNKPVPTLSAESKKILSEKSKKKNSSKSSKNKAKKQIEIKKEAVSVKEAKGLKQKFENKYPEHPTKPIIVEFKHGDKKIANDFRFTGKLGTQLKKSDLPDIPGYKLNLRSEINYEIKLVEQRITLYYEPYIIKFRLVPVNEKKEQIPAKELKTFKDHPGEIISSAKYPLIKGYHPFPSRKYVVPAKDGDVKVFYSADPQKFELVYQTTDGESLLSIPMKGHTGEEYKIDPKAHTFPGYELAEVPDNIKGVFTPDLHRLVLKFAPVDSSIEVQFLDSTGNTIHKPLTYTGKYKTPYLIKTPPIDGFELTSDQSLLSGNYDKKPKKVVLRYKRATKVVNINLWFDKEFKHSAGKTRHVSGLVDSNYESVVPEIDGYVPNIKVAKGTFDAYENPDVNVIYSKIPCVAHIIFVDEAERPLPGIKPMIKKGLWGEKFTAELPEVAGFERPKDKLVKKFTQENQTETIHYSAKEIEITVSFLDSKTGKAIAEYPAEKIKGLVGTSYTIEAPMIDGYRLSKAPENASGVYAADPKPVTFTYDPNPSELILHYYATTLDTIKKNKVIPGFYGKDYEIKPEEIAGYDYESASDDLKGTFPASRQDIDLYYKPKQVEFTLVPVDQFGKVIGSQFNVSVMGLVNQSFSTKLPQIPGYYSNSSGISGTILPEYHNKRFVVRFKPETESILIHYLYNGGAKDGLHAFRDYEATGDMGSQFVYDVPAITGYTPNTNQLKTRFTSEKQELTVVYSVLEEEYQIQFVDKNNNLVGGMPKNKGYYNESVEFAQAIPKGFHLPAGVDDHIFLDGSKIYKIIVVPDALTLELIPQTQDGIDLGSHRQISGAYHQPQTLEVPVIPGYTPVNDKKIKVNFELGQTKLPIIYSPEEKTLTVRLISASGEAIRREGLENPVVVKGYYQKEYEIEAPKIDGYVLANENSKIKTGTFGLHDIETAFVYVPGSDQLNRAITPLEELIKESQEATDSEDKVEVNDFVPAVDTPASDHTEVPEATRMSNEDTLSDSEKASSENGNSQAEAPSDLPKKDHATNLLDTLYKDNDQDE